MTNGNHLTGSGQRALSDALRVSFNVLRAVMALMVVLYLLSGLFVVRQHERAFVLIFGRIAGTGEDRLRGPGIHWTFPAPIAEIVRIPTERVRAVESETFWYYLPPESRVTGEQPPPAQTLDPLRDGYTLSGDANLLHSRWVLRYTVDHPAAYVFENRNPAKILRNELDHAVIRASAGFNIDQALRTDIEMFRSTVARMLQQRVREHQLGVQIERVDLLAVTPPRQVAAAFDAVVEAEQERSSLISAARGAAGRSLNEARGEAARTISEAQAYRTRLVSETGAAADYFEAVLAKTRLYPEITIRTLWQDTLRRVLGGVDETFYIYGSRDGYRELRLLLNPETRRRPRTEP